MLDNGDTSITEADNATVSIYDVLNDSGYWNYQADYLAMKTEAPIKSENNGRVAEKDGTLIIDGGKVVVRPDGSVLVNGTVVAAGASAQAKPSAPG